MQKLINNARTTWNVIIFFLLLTLSFVSENHATEFFPNISFPTFSSSKASSTAPYQWIKVLQSNEPFQVILIDKASQSIDLLEYKEGSYEVLASYDCATGENPGHKYKSGDLKTPEGIYFITESFTDNKITIFGKRAFHLDYPNPFDKSEQRNGDGIYIHGTNKKLVPNSTNGCITMQNQDLDLLAKFLIEHKTPVIIVDDKKELQKLAINLTGIRQDTILSLLVPDEISQDDLKVNNLFVISNGTQNVAFGKFIISTNHFPYKTSFSRVYLTKGEDGHWIIDKRVFRGPLVRVEPVRKKIQIAKIQIAKTHKTVQPEKKETTPVAPGPKIQVAKVSKKVQVEKKETPPAVTKPTIQVAKVRKKVQAEKKETPPAVTKPTIQVAKVSKKVQAEKKETPPAVPKPKIQVAKVSKKVQPEKKETPPVTPEPKIQVAKVSKKVQPEKKETPPVAPEPKIQVVKVTKKVLPEIKELPPATSESKIQVARVNKKVQAEKKEIRSADPSLQTKGEIIRFIEKWRRAWQNKQLDAYIECYAKNFKQGKKNLEAWRKYKQRLNKKYKTIRVAIDDIKINLHKNGAQVEFHQVYKSDKFSADGNKRLILTHTEEGWQILREQWLN